MWEYSKMIGSLLGIALLLAHLFLLALFLAPADKLLSLVIRSNVGFVEVSDLPEKVEEFLLVNHVPVRGEFMPDSKVKTRLVLGILHGREARIMDEREKLVLNMNLLDYGQGLVGIKSAAPYYFEKQLEELSDKHWITLVHLQGIDQGE